MLSPITPYKISYQKAFLSNKKEKQNDKIQDDMLVNKTLMFAGIGATVAFGMAAAIRSMKQGVVSVDKISAIKNEMKKYANDVIYRKTILKEMNIPEENYYKLRSIIGVEELNVAIKELSKDKESFLPGKKTFRLDKEPIFGRENVENGKFAANLHLHTRYSDGAFTIPELIEHATKYANERVEKLGKNKPFYLAITDHDTLAGCQEVVDIIYKNPEKYKNLRLVLGVENTVITDYPQFLKNEVETHMISYCINPFDKELLNHYNSQVQQNRANIQSVLDFANEKYFKILRNFEIDYNLEEFDKLAPQIKYRNIQANYLTKDYLQFKLIYSSMVEKNEALLEATGLKPAMFDFVRPQSLIGETLDYSQGQRYYEYYLNAIKEDLKTKLPIEKHSEVEKHLRFIPDEIKPILEEIEAAVGDINSSLHVHKVKHPMFDEAVKFLSTKEGDLGIAHPGVVFPMDSFKSEADTIKFYDVLYSDFKQLAPEKAKYAEDNYATYFEDQSNEFLNNLSNTSAKYGLEKTGGLDTHVADIFRSK